MERHEKVERIVRILSIGLGVIVAKAVYDSALSYGLHFGFSVPAMLTAVGVLAWLIGYLLEQLFERSHFVRKHLLGRMFVDGVWIEIIRHEGALVGVSKVFIGSSGFEMTLSGQNYRIKLGPPQPVPPQAANLATGNFRARMIRIKWPVLKYTYTHYPSNRPERTDGYGEMQFSEEIDCPPIEYRGHFVHVATGTLYYVEGRRAKTEELPQLKDPDIREKMICEIAGSLAKRVIEIER